jgi:UDP-galactopyranose mutase
LSAPRTTTQDEVVPPERGDLVVFSHLRWDFVFQRPQHLMSRLAEYWRVWFVEEPVPSDAPGWIIDAVAPNVLVCRPRTGRSEPGFASPQAERLIPLVRSLLEAHGVRRPVVWLYTPLATPLLAAVPASAVVYDCMDELSAFLNAPPELLARETELLDAADVVFTGGPSLYRAKRSRHPAVHCFPSSVEVEHFARARVCAEAEDQAALPRPRLGFYGVIDERLDTALIDTVARRRPDWQLVMVGPVVKIDPASLPRRPNIAYVGMRSYEALPSYLAGWDVCLLPFARNEATRFISPTKTLEYMAAELPIVSTPIEDVAEPYGRIVYLGGTPDEFVAACEQALGAGVLEREARATRARAVLRGTSWDDTARRMRDLLDWHATAGASGTRRQEGKRP